MNISVKVGYQSFILRNVSANMVDIIMKGVGIDTVYNGEQYVQCLHNEKICVSVISESDIPTMTRSEIENIRDNNGNQDTIES